MLVQELKLRDFRGYRDAQVTLGDQLTVVHGPNGAIGLRLHPAGQPRAAAHPC